jgi:hypothetical protein
MIECAAQTFLVEHYWPGATAERFEAAAARVRAATERMRGEGARIRFLHSVFVPEDEAAYCVFEAPAAAGVEEAYRRAAVRFERIVVAVEAEA